MANTIDRMEHIGAMTTYPMSLIKWHFANGFSRVLRAGFCCGEDTRQGSSSVHG
jgi:hypothetical protein